MPFYDGDDEYESLDDYYQATRRPTKAMKIAEWRRNRDLENMETASADSLTSHAAFYGQEVNEEGDVVPPSNMMVGGVWGMRGALKRADRRAFSLQPRRSKSFKHGCGTCGCGEGGECDQ